MKHSFYWKGLTLISLFAFLIFNSCNEDQENFETERSSHNKELEKYLSKFEVVTIDFKLILNTAQQNPTTPIEINLNIDSKPNWRFHLEADPIDIDFTDDFKAFEVGKENQLTQVDMPENHALKGKLGNSTELSYFIINNEYLEGSIYDQDKEYYLEPLRNYDQSAPIDQYVLYETDDLIPQDAECKTKNLDEERNLGENLGVRNPNRPWYVEVTMLGDYQVYQKFYNTTYALNYLYYRLYYSNRRHITNQTSARLVTKRLYIYTSSASRYYYPNGNYLSVSLPQITNFYYYNWYDRGDVNYFITGDNVYDPAGLAYLRTICNSPSIAFGIGVYYPAGTLANNLMAHETGHTMGLNHDASAHNIMYPSLNYNKTFTNYSKNQLTYWLGIQNSCLYR